MGRVRRPGGDREVFRLARFGAAAAAGFVVAEALIVAGLYGFYGRADVPSSASSSPTLLALDVFALVTGVTVSFFLNERITVGGGVDEEREGPGRVLFRLLKFQGVCALGNAVTIGVQVALLAAFGLTPAVGNVVGAVVSYPVAYVVSMRLVWKGRPRAPDDEAAPILTSGSSES